MKYALTLQNLRSNGRDSINREEVDNASFFVGAAPSAADRFLVFGAASRLDPPLAR